MNFSGTTNVASAAGVGVFYDVLANR
jgi:hypothetical protein